MFAPKAPVLEETTEKGAVLDGTRRQVNETCSGGVAISLVWSQQQTIRFNAQTRHEGREKLSRPVEELRGKSWDADALNALLAPDLATDMLDWMDGTFGPAVDPDRFAAFAGLAAMELKFDPRKLSRQDAARRLAARQGRWSEVWNRFASSNGYSGVVSLLSLE